MTPKINLSAMIKKDSTNEEDREKIIENGEKNKEIIEQKENKISINSIVKKPDTKKELQIEENEIKKNEKPLIKNEDDDGKEIFNNYKSDFKEKKEPILKRINEKRKKIQEKLKQKTRIIFVLVLILGTFGSILALFTFDSEHHNIKRYKNILISNINNFKENYIPKSEEEIRIEKERLNKIKKEKEKEIRRKKAEERKKMILEQLRKKKETIIKVLKEKYEEE